MPIDLSSHTPPSSSATAPATTTQHQLPDWEGKTPTTTRNSKIGGGKNFFTNLFSSSSQPKEGLFATKAEAEDQREPDSEIPGSGIGAGAASSSDPEIPSQTKISSPPAPGHFAFSRHFNSSFPVDRTYYGRSRKTMVVVVGAVVAVVLLALILGLGLGLGLRRHNSSQNLPLPSNTGIFTGDLTYYAPGLGACGITSSSTDSICAVSHILFDAASTSGNPNANPLCGMKIRIQRYDESVGSNRSVDVTVVDRCVGCMVDDLDLSLKMFEELADEDLGRVTGSWAWLN